MPVSAGGTSPSPSWDGNHQKIPVESLGSIPGSQIEQNINSAIIYQANHIMSITVYPLIFVDS